MTLLVQCQQLAKSFGSRMIFTDLSMSIFTGDRIGLIGPNGAGKSTLLKIIGEIESADEGEVTMSRGLNVGYVPQTCNYPAIPPKQVLINVLQKTPISDYEKEVLAEEWLNKLGFKEKEPLAAQLSGGWKKRLSIAEQLISSPDLLLLDEPTNHLDLEGILWLEQFLQQEETTFVLVSHDRYFLQNVTRKTIEISPAYPQGTFAIDAPYKEFLKRREEFMSGQLERERSLSSKARHEKEWLRRSPKARTTKSKSRVEGAHELFDELSELKKRNLKKRAGIDFAASGRETRKLLIAKNLTKGIGERTLFQKLDFTLSPGTRMGLMGLNGTGKTTLLRLLSSELQPDEGTIKRADQLKVVYFDQHRAQLSDDLTLKDALSPTGDYVTYLGRQIHVAGWCKRFLFSPDTLDMPIGRLSGGERARIAIAHLMLQPADLLLLDEPTNDLDIPTLETLEESLLEFPGAVVLITHDRYMLDRVCNQFLGLGDPSGTDLYSEYAQWEMSRKGKQVVEKEVASEKKTRKADLTYQEKKEGHQIERKIAKLEAGVQKLTHLLEDEKIAGDPEKLQKVCDEIAIEETKIEQLYLRLFELDQKKQK